MKTTLRNKFVLIFGVLAILVLAAMLLIGIGAEQSQPVPASAQPAIVVVEEGATPAETTAETAETPVDNSKGWKAIAAGIAIGLASAVGAISMGLAISKSNEATARQPEASGKIRSNLMLGLILIETAIIYALIISILVIFAL